MNPTDPSSPARFERQWLAIDLPSQGRYYYGAMSGKVHVCKLTGREEAIFNNQGIDGVDKIEAILRNCVQMPEKFEYEAFNKKFSGIDGLLSSDKMALLHAIREYSHGGSYNMNWRCANCNSQQRTKINLKNLQWYTPADVETRFADEGRGDVGEEPFSVTLQDVPDTTVSVRFPRSRDDVEIRKRVAFLRGENPSLNHASTVRRACLISAVSNVVEWPTLTLPQREGWVRSCLSWADGQRIDNTLNRRNTGVAGGIDCRCSQCGAASTVGVDYDMEFFRPADI